MSLSTYLALVGLFLQFYVTFRGRSYGLFTVAQILAVMVLWFSGKRLVEARKNPMKAERRFVLVVKTFRIIQLVLCMAITYPLVFAGVGGETPIDVYWCWVIVLFGDDLLTGGPRDRWKRRWEKLKNAVKWKWLPSMEPHPIRVPS